MYMFVLLLIIHMTLSHDDLYNENHNLHVILITFAVVHSAISKSRPPPTS